MAESTELDALIAAMLGDIGKLHEAVEGLNVVLPKQTDDLEQRIGRLVMILDKAGEVYKDSIQAYTDSQCAVVKEQLEKDTEAGRLRVYRDYSEIVAKAHADVEKTIKATVNDEISTPMKDVLGVLKQHAWKTIVMGMLTATVTIMLVLGGTAIVYNHRLQTEALFGRAVFTLWGKLDKKTKAMIQAEAGAQDQ